MSEINIGSMKIERNELINLIKTAITQADERGKEEQEEKIKSLVDLIDELISQNNNNNTQVNVSQNNNGDIVVINDNGDKITLGIK